jgi:hypothetical protein
MPGENIVHVAAAGFVDCHPIDNVELRGAKQPTEVCCGFLYLSFG